MDRLYLEGHNVAVPFLQEAFNHAGLRNNPWTSECMNCGLALNGGGVAPPRV